VNCSGPVATFCQGALAIADVNRDDLLTRVEYVQFVNRLSQNAYEGVDYVNLSDKKRVEIFIAFTFPVGEIDISGSKPVRMDATDEQDAFLSDLCCATDSALRNPYAPNTHFSVYHPQHPSLLGRATLSILASPRQEVVALA
jgi:hypothetical protein